MICSMVNEQELVCLWMTALTTHLSRIWLAQLQWPTTWVGNVMWTMQLRRQIASLVDLLKWNLKTWNKTTKSNAYRSLIRPHLEYCCSVWSSSTDEPISKLEVVQRRSAARFVFDQYQRTTAMLQLCWKSSNVNLWRTKGQLLLYKIIHNLVDFLLNLT